LLSARASGITTPMQDQLYGMRERLAFIAGAFIMLAIVTASGWLAVHTVRDLNEAERAQALRATTVDLLQAVTQAETGQRGFLLTGKPEYLMPYNEAQGTVPALLDQVGRDLGRDPGFAALRSVIERKMAELAHTVRLAKDGKHDAAMQVVLSDVGQLAMYQARGLAQRLTDRQRAVLQADISRSQTGAETVVAVDALALLVLVVITVFVTGSARRYVRDLRAAQAGLQAANAELAAGRERLEVAVRERTAELTSANEEIQRFAYIVSHDLRAPLLNIIGFSSELEHATATLRDFVNTHIAASDVAVPEAVREATEADLPEAIRFIQTSTAKMDRLINAILRLSREGRRVLTPEALDMGRVLADIVDSVRHQANAGEAEVTVGEVPPVVSDRIAVEQVFTNLVDNALKYGHPARPSRIAIEGRREGVWAVFSVADNGRGIAARDMERVFELFRRAGVQDRPGEGIGLAHVRALVRRLGGAIECVSTPDVGSVFSVRLPLVLSHLPPEPT
jgi:signal transduction histidine kinase